MLYEVVDLFATLLWSIWKARNKLQFQQKTSHHTHCFKLAHQLLAEYQEANIKVSSLDPPAPKSQPRWFPPLPGLIKFNSDASIGANGDAGLGGAFRNHFGELILPLASVQPQCPDVEVAEGLACFQGVCKAHDVGFQNLIVEVDNQVLALALQKGTIPRTPVGTIIADSIHASSDFHSICFKWIGRHQNSLAHFLASQARNPDFSFDADNPLFVALLRIVSKDASPVS